ncbi:MAG: CoA pyrophosphatase [Owenweeksia sp.]|nr:CoA pyrophosphatase [Owenweeksia sp.]
MPGCNFVLAINKSNHSASDYIITLETIFFNQLKRRLAQALNAKLPGADAQQLMAPLGRSRITPDESRLINVRKAAVLALFIEKKKRPELVLILRTNYKGVHGGQISLPGGKVEPQDRNYRHTALRETHEEVGLAPENIDIIGQLSQLYIPPSNYLVQPYVGIFKGSAPYFEKEQQEVQEIFTVDINQLLAPQSISKQEVNASGQSLQVPVFKIDQYVIWGATAMMLSELRQALLQSTTAAQ